MMQATFVPSSNLDAVGYQRGTLAVRFKSGAAYQYKKVPHAVYVRLIEAESPGQTFHKEVRGKFEYEKLNFDPFGRAS